MVATAISAESIWDVLAGVPDPEIPVLSIVDLGIVRGVDVDDGVTVTLTPTYTGCPATEVIEGAVRAALREHGIDDADVRRSLSPPWTTDWISADGKRKLRDYGIAPPERGRDVACPQCGSVATEQVSEFGSTACKSAWRCTACLEPFEHFKCL